MQLVSPNSFDNLSCGEPIWLFYVKFIQEHLYYDEKAKFQICIVAFVDVKLKDKFIKAGFGFEYDGHIFTCVSENLIITIAINSGVVSRDVDCNFNLNYKTNEGKSPPKKDPIDSIEGQEGVASEINSIEANSIKANIETNVYPILESIPSTEEGDGNCRPVEEEGAVKK